MLSSVRLKIAALSLASMLLCSLGCTRDISQLTPSGSSGSSSRSSSSPAPDEEELPPEPVEEEEMGREWYSYSGVGADKLSWTLDGEYAVIVYPQMVQLLDLDNQPAGELPFPEGCGEEYAVGERGVLFYGLQTRREKPYPSKCIWQTADGQLFIAGVTLMEYSGEVVKEVPAVEVQGSEYTFQGTKVVPVMTYEESWQWVDDKTLLLTTVEDAPDSPGLTTKFYYRYYPNTDRVRLIISGNDFVSVRSNKSGIFYDSYHTTNEWGSIQLADELGIRTILDGMRFSAYAVSDELIAMLRWTKNGSSTLWYAWMDDLVPQQITGVEEYTREMDRWGSLDGIYGHYVPLGGDAFYDVEAGEVTEIPQPDRVALVNAQGTHWIQVDEDNEAFRVVPLED